MKLSVCIDSLFRGWDLGDALRVVQANGIEAFEFWNWRTKDIDRLEAEMKSRSLTLSAFCTNGGTLVSKEAHRAYVEGIRDAVKISKRLGCSTLITTAGAEQPGVEHERQLEHMVAGLRMAEPIVEDAGITLVLEPLNTRIDHPGHFLSRSNDAFSLIDQVGSRHVKVLFDIYHQHITEGNVLQTMLERLPEIGHIHAAGYPGRHELQIGDIAYEDVFAELHSAGYKNYIGLEYVPSIEHDLGLVYANGLCNSFNT